MHTMVLPCNFLRREKSGYLKTATEITVDRGLEILQKDKTSVCSFMSD